MIPLTMTASILLILLFATVWHDEPARPLVVHRRADQKQSPHE